MPESMSERERYIANPLRLLRNLADLAFIGVQAIDNALYDFDDHRPYTETNYPPIGQAEAPVASEDEL